MDAAFLETRGKFGVVHGREGCSIAPGVVPVRVTDGQKRERKGVPFTHLERGTFQTVTLHSTVGNVLTRKSQERRVLPGQPFRGSLGLGTMVRVE